MTATIDRILERLRQPEGSTEALEYIRAWADRGQVRDLVDLWTAVSSAPIAGPGYDAVADEIEESLALAKGEASLDALFDLAFRGRRRAKKSEVDRVRPLASRLAFARPKEDLLAAATRASTNAGSFELFACWMHELVLRGNKLDAEPAAQKLAAMIEEKKHPLAGMPLRLLAAEREAPSYMPMYGDGAIDRAVARLESGPTSTQTVPPPAEHEAPKATPIDDAAVVARIRRAIEPWVTGSKGKADARVFSLSPSVETTAVGRWLVRALPLDAASGEGLEIRRVQAEAVWGMLFAAGANGGAYSSGLGGAYGRQAAWASFGALVGCAGTATLDQIDEAATRASFLFFSGSDWFHDVAWDIGVLALRPDGATAAVLAATDTD